MASLTHLQDDQHDRNAKSLHLIIAVAVLFLLLVARLFYLQVVQAELNLRLSKENAMRLKVLVPPRGCIYDRNGELIALNRPSYSICVLPARLGKNRGEVISRLCRIRDSSGAAVFDSAEVAATIRRACARRFEPTRLKEDVSLDLMSVVEEHSMELPGIVVEAESRREYPLVNAAFHVLGYMGEIPEEQFDSLRKQGYNYGDLVGKAGLERRYETVMRGTCGREYIAVNAHGKSLGPIASIPRIDPVPGSNLYLTIDSRLQRVAAEAMSDSLKGAVVAIDPRNGEVLAMLSRPSVDPNIFSMAGTIRSKKWVGIATDSMMPLNNRATCGVYPPGSTFKLVSALAALEAGGFTESTHMTTPCRGAYRIGTRIARCWNPRGHGDVDLIEAIQKSCNVYLYQLGLQLGDKVINRYADELGLGKKTGIDLPLEKSGWLSGEEAYNVRYQRKGWVWTRGLLLDLAIGQLQLTTPLQLALMVGGLGNGKVIHRPMLVKEERNGDGIVTRQYRSRVSTELNFHPTSIATLHKAMLSVVEPGGTGGRASVPGIPVGGKTGSAENPQGELTQALFVACAPVDDPVIAVAVVAENAGHGGSVAAPIAGKVLRAYFDSTAEGQAVAARYRENDVP